MSRAICCWCGAPLVEAEGAFWCGNADPKCRVRQAEHALDATEKKTGARRWLYVPTPRQVTFHETVRQVRRVLYGGQAGPGKSHALRWGLYRDCMQIPNLNCLLLRRTYQQLEQTHLNEMMRDQKLIGATYTSGDKCMRFPNGSIIRAGHCETTADAMNYLSTEYDRIAFDELVTFDRDPSLEIMSRARTSKAAVKASGDAQVWAGTNPGGRGALWVKEFFIDHAVDVSEFPSYDPARYGFVNATLEDNPYISDQYRRDLEDLPEMRKRQLLYGDWNAFEGQFFSEWRPSVHVRDLPIAPGIEHFASMDWGFNAFGCVLWWAQLPDGRYHVRWEYKFKGVSAEVVALEIQRITKSLGVKLGYLVCDPAMKQKTGAGRGESIFETLLRRGLPMRGGDNDRFNGWNRVHELLRLDDDDQPWITVSPDCKYLIRTLPAMVQDDHDPEDIDSSKDDHAVDALRYGAMSRPSPTRFVKDETLTPNSIAWWKKYPTGKPEPRGVLV
jgi:hypothetical protein